MKRKFLWGLGTLLALLTLWIAAVMLAGAVQRARVPVSLFPFAMVITGGSIVEATGTWEIEGRKHAFPLQTTRIYCEQKLKRCTSATAQVGAGDQMMVQLDFFDIAEWNSSQIIFTDNAPACVKYIYTIDLLTKSVSGIRVLKPSPAPEDVHCQDLAKELHLRLRKGFDVWFAQSQDAIPWFGRIAIAPLKLFW